MSDDADNYFNAWKAVFGEGDSKKIICAWHIDRTWRKALAGTVRDKDQIKIYNQLSILLNERDKAKFRITLQAFLTYPQTKHTHLFAYFTSNYCSWLPQWAICYCTQMTINTNMYLESFHRVLKILYLNHKQNRRIDLFH